MRKVLSLIPGTLLALAIAFAAKWLEGLEKAAGLHIIGASVIALFIGMAVNAVWKPNSTTAPGIKFTSKKLLKFTLDDGSGTDRQILSGIAMYYKPEDLVGKTLVAIVNLPPRKMMGQESQGMLLSAVHKENDEERLNLVMLNDAIPAGAKLC